MARLGHPQPSKQGEPNLTNRRRGRPALTSRADILDAVLALGFDAATMTSVAARVGVEPSTLYGYFANRADLLAAAAERAVEGMRWPSPGDDWRAYLRDATEAMWELFEANRGFAGYVRAVESVPDDVGRRTTEVAVFLLHRFGMPMRDAAVIVDTLGDLVIDSYLTVERLRQPTEAGGTVADDLRARLEAASSGADAAFLTEVSGAIADTGSWWRDKVGLVLDGVAYRWERDHTGS